MRTRLRKLLVVSAATLVVASCGAKTTGNGGNAEGNVGGSTSAHKPKEAGKDQKVVLHYSQGKWWVQLNGGKDEEPSKATTRLEVDTGPTKFVVTIQGKAVTFPQAGALTVWEDTKSATPGSTQILGPVVSPDGQQLTFFDLNQGPALKIYYGLKLSDGTSIDPIVDNGGGGNMR